METLEAGVARTALPTIADISTGSFTESIQELMQNARMAGASRIDIDVHGDTVTVTDNGHGILHPEALLTYGMSTMARPRPRDAERHGPVQPRRQHDRDHDPAGNPVPGRSVDDDTHSAALQG